jgi:RimJ/RimL family protein N-acetyltransferase
MWRTIYRLPANEMNRYRDHLLTLDDESKYMRFGFMVKPETIDSLCSKWAEKSDQHKIFVIEDANLNIIGVAHVSLEGDTPELAFSVLKDYQRQGLGDALMKRAIEYCQNKGIEHGYMVCLPANDKIKKLARKNGVLLHTEDGDCEGDITIPSPTPISVWHEYVEDSMGKIDHLGKTQRKIARLFRFPLTF